MKITSSYAREWPKLGFSIAAGEEKELPADKNAAAAILATDGVSEVSKVKDAPKPVAKDEAKDSKTD